MNKRSKKASLPPHLRHININAAGIDIGSNSHFVSVPEDRDEHSVREFKSFTRDLHELAVWLKKCGIETVAMESTGVYWVPLYELLEEYGFEVLLVNAHHVKNVSGRKSDVLDCQWIRELHTYGLLSGAFRPSKEICELRAYVRQRSNLVRFAASHIQHMQKALDLMNLHLHNVISDITGTTGQKIIRAILNGEHDPKILAQYRDGRCKQSIEVIEKSLVGHYKKEHIFSLKQAVELYDFYQCKIEDCDIAIESLLKQWTPNVSEEALALPKRRKTKSSPKFEISHYLYEQCGVDLTSIDGIDSLSVLKIISEVGTDMSRWKSEKCFGSWMGLAPGTKISGGKVLKRSTKSSANRAAAILRICATSLYNSPSALGAFLRRMKGKLGSPKAVTATAYKLAKLIYRMLKQKISYNDMGQDYYEQRYKERLIRNLKRKAALLGLELLPIELLKNKELEIC
jgi:transposase